MTTAEEDIRASGKTASEEMRDAIAATADEPTSTELPDERERKFRFPGFSRMRTEWFGEDGLVLRMVEAKADDVIDEAFNDLIAVRQELYDVVRAPELDEYGKVRLDRHGWVIWARDENGNYDESWKRFNREQQERFLFLITTRIFEWEERMDKMWLSAMMGKTQWEEAFSTGWQATEGNRPTEGDKTAQGRLTSQGERYFAIYLTYLSRRAESLVRGMERLAQRIKDVHTA